MWSDLFKNTKLASMKYKPSLFTLNEHLQLIVFCLMPLFERLFKDKVRYSRQIYGLKDGGELALDWMVHSADSEKTIRNMVVCIPGLSGDSGELYCT